MMLTYIVDWLAWWHTENGMIAKPAQSEMACDYGMMETSGNEFHFTFAHTGRWYDVALEMIN